PDLTAKIDAAANRILAMTGAPSASIAVVKDGRIAYAHAYGLANVETKTAATPQMRYSVGSVSKQFTTAAIMMFVEEGKLSLDDKVGKWFPDLTRANDVTVRQLLSMTSGYQDFWPQDYVMPTMLKPVTAAEIMNTWARKPLDFEPGTKWQYSNTNYVIAGQIVERVSGAPVFELLQKRVFAPLHMATVTNVDEAPLGSEDAARYLRYGVGPLRPAPKEARGWLSAAGELAMTATDLAKWDISLIDQSVLKPSSYREMETEVELKNGAGTDYALGLKVNMIDGRRQLAHGGEISGFTSENDVYPDDRVAIVALTNIDAASAASQIAARIGQLLFTPPANAALDQATQIFAALRSGRIDRSLFTSNANAYFSEQALADFAASLTPLGAPTSFTQTGEHSRGGMTMRDYRIVFRKQAFHVWTFTMPDGKLEQYMIAPAE
ncbi:MAG TPA: serine hydrolase domain-containing protein, partial [Thermoanaerobaculia bacterium]